MTNTTEAGTRAAEAQSSVEITDAELERVREFTREPVLLDGETLADLAPGTARRMAVDSAMHESEAGAEAPSMEWRREFSLVLGLERLLSEETPELLDGAVLDPHQVDALSGTLAALSSEVELSKGNGVGGNGRAPTEPADPEDVELEGDASANGEK